MLARASGSPLTAEPINEHTGASGMSRDTAARVTNWIGR